MKYGALKSIPRETNINGQFHQLSYIRPDEAELLKSMGGAGTAGPGGVPQYGWRDWANDNLGTSFDTGSSTPSAPSNNNSNDDKPSTFTAIKDTFTEIFTLGTADTDTYNSTEPSNTFVTDVGQAAADTLKEVITLGAADTQTYNSSDYNLNYDATGGNTSASTALEIRTLDSGQKYSVDANGNFVALVGGAAAQVFYDINGGSHSSQAAADQATATINSSGTSVAEANRQLADSMTEAGILSLGGKQMPDEPDNQGNTPIIRNFRNEDGSSGAEIVGGLDGSSAATMSTNADGSLFVPYDGQDPYSIDADTNFYGSTDPNAADYNMSLDLAQTGSYVDLSGNTVTGEPFTTDFSVNGAALLNELGKDHLLKTGDDSKMITVLDGGGYTFLNDDKKITDDVFEEIIDKAIDDDLLPPDILGPVDEDPPVIFEPPVESGPITRQVRGTKDLYGDFYGGQSGGLWNRFQGSYLTRFNQPTQGIDEMVRVVEQEDGSKLYYGADGALLNPDAIGQIRISGDPTSLKIGEQNVLLGTQTLNPDGTVKDTSYTDLYDPEIDAGLFDY